MKYREIKINLPKDAAEPFNQFLEETGTLGHYEILFDPSLKKEGEIISDYTNMKVYLQENDHENELRILIFLNSNAPGNFFSETRIIETNDYMTSYQEYYKPFSAGKLVWVIPVWDKEKPLPENSALPLYINPGLAFGTGHHETTRLMLGRLETVVEKGMSVLDAGCGSGILSIACGKLGATDITAFDIDPNAKDSTLYNWQQNEFAPDTKILVLEGGFDLPEVTHREFDLAVINITFAVISSNMAEIAKINSKRFLFSGVIEEKREELENMLVKMVGGHAVYRDSMNDWIILEWNKTRG